MICHLSPKIVFILANSANPHEMLLSATFHLGFHCLPKLPINRLPVYKELIMPITNAIIRSYMHMALKKSLFPPHTR